MSYQYEVSRTATFPIKITCEACGHEYQRDYARITVELTIPDDISSSGNERQTPKEIMRNSNIMI